MDMEALDLISVSHSPLTSATSRCDNCNATCRASFSSRSRNSLTFDPGDGLLQPHTLLHHTHTHSHLHIHSHSFSLTHTLTHLLTHTQTHTHTLSHTHTITHSLSLSHTHIHTYTHTLSLTAQACDIWISGCEMRGGCCVGASESLWLAKYTSSVVPSLIRTQIGHVQCVSNTLSIPTD